MKDYSNMPLNTWWSLPEIIQSAIAKLVPNQSDWLLECSKHEYGVWTFSLPQFLTFDESLCNGTELVLDNWYERLTGETPEPGARMDVLISTLALESYDTRLDFAGDDPAWANSSLYKDTVLNLPVWLCPYLQVLFKGKPEKLWVELMPR